ncbi:hypothetical protein D3C79_646110 [compost metagenome]
MALSASTKLHLPSLPTWKLPYARLSLPATKVRPGLSASLAVRVPVTGVRSPSVAAPVSAEMTGRSSVPVMVMVTTWAVPSAL